MLMSQYRLALLLLSGVLITACNEVSQAQLDEVRAIAQEGRTMAAEARDIAIRAEQKADQALAVANDAKSTADQALAEVRACCQHNKPGLVP